MKFLLKYPSRERPDLFADTVNAWTKLSSGKHQLSWLVSLDEDDPELHNYQMNMLIGVASSITPIIGKSKNKIDAVNRDMQHATKGWQTLIVVSDDMRPTVKNWDEIIASQMPTLDMGLWFPDGRQKRLCTLSIFGRPVLDRLGGYIYHPSFESVYADDFYQLQMQTWGILKFVDSDVFAHEWKVHNDDGLMKRNEDRGAYVRDKETYTQMAQQFIDDFSKANQ